MKPATRTELVIRQLEIAPTRRFVLAGDLFCAGRVGVKLSAPYETSKTGAPRYEDVSELARALARYNPERCLGATNWPHPGRNAPPDNADILNLLADWVPDEGVRKRILVDNPARLYGF